MEIKKLTVKVQSINNRKKEPSLRTILSEINLDKKRIDALTSELAKKHSVEVGTYPLDIANSLVVLINGYTVDSRNLVAYTVDESDNK